MGANKAQVHKPKPDRRDFEGLQNVPNLEANNILGHDMRGRERGQVRRTPVALGSIQGSREDSLAGL